MAHRDGDEVLAGERHLTGEQLVQDDTERVDVGVLVHTLALCLLRRDVVGRAEHRPGLGHPVLHVEGAGDAEVRHLRLAVAVEQDVLRLDVTMDKPLLVGEGEPLRDLDRQLDGRRHRNGTAPDQLLQVLAVDVLEDDELTAVVLTAVDHRDDVRMRERCDGPRLVTETPDVLGVTGVLLVQDLQRDLAVEQPVVCPIDARHAAAADERLELVAV